MDGASCLKRLASVRRMRFCAVQRQGGTVRGVGTVRTCWQDRQTLLCSETLYLANGIRSRDEKRWHWDGQHLYLARRRNGAYETLFQLADDGEGWAALCPFECPPDRYQARLLPERRTLLLAVRVWGSRKDDYFYYRYTV